VKNADKVQDEGQKFSVRFACLSLFKVQDEGQKFSARFACLSLFKVQDEGQKFSARFACLSLQVAIWNHRAGGAEALASELRSEGITATAETDIESTCRSSHIITCATLSPDPVIKGEWLGPGTHLDLVGGFTPLMREADDEAIRKSSVWPSHASQTLSQTEF
jgi:hypothetical protein